MTDDTKKDQTNESTAMMFADLGEPITGRDEEIDNAWTPEYFGEAVAAEPIEETNLSILRRRLAARFAEFGGVDELYDPTVFGFIRDNAIEDPATWVALKHWIRGQAKTEGKGAAWADEWIAEITGNDWTPDADANDGDTPAGPLTEAEMLAMGNKAAEQESKREAHLAAKQAKAEAEEAKEAERMKYIHSIAGDWPALGERWKVEYSPEKPPLLCERELGPSWSGIPLGRIAILAGDAGVGKSTLALQLACIVASGAGATWCGHTVKASGKVLYLGAEDDELLTGRRVRYCMETLGIRGDERDRLTANLGLPSGRLPAGSALIETQRMSLGPTQLGEEFNGRAVNSVSATYTAPGNVLNALDAAADKLEHGDLKLIVIDPLNAFSAADVETNPDIAGALMRYAGDLAEKTGATVLFTHHTRKPATTSGGSKVHAPNADSIRGTSALKGQVRWAGIVYKGMHKYQPGNGCPTELCAAGEGSSVVTFRTVKANDGRDYTPPWTMERNALGIPEDIGAEELNRRRMASDPDAKPKEDPDALAKELAAEAAKDAI